jgi:uncharacterized protein (TIGR03435 family)
MLDFQLMGGPDWLASDRFDIAAKAASTPTTEQLRAMVRGLLAERFAFKSHIETREMPTYALMKASRDGKLGPGIKPSSECQPQDGPPPPGQRPCGVSFRVSRGSMMLILGGQPLAELAKNLRPILRRMVIDETGLDARFDVDLEFGADQFPLPAETQRDFAPAGLEGLSILTALQEQLGLKLQSTKGPVDVLVIDHAERPTED